MIRASALLLPLVLLNGCILYDGTFRCRNHDDSCAFEEGGVEGDTAGLSNGDGSGGDTGEAAPEASFALDPSEADGGDVFIASLTAENFDLATIGAIEAFGPATVAAVSNRGDEVLLTVAVDADAEEGATVDLLLHVGDDAVFVEAVLVVHAASDDGGAAGEGDGDGSNGDCDTGSGAS